MESLLGEQRRLSWTTVEGESICKQKSRDLYHEARRSRGLVRIADSSSENEPTTRTVEATMLRNATICVVVLKKLPQVYRI
mmetsp:Transcript_52635/g.157680  ORF Transcript_52635/g.157680 Transcript_52635/m.157680 type:complete len:81 (-) Transcript_52635:170-412(-)